MNWPWENTTFIKQGNYCKNNWPPASVKLITDDQTHPATLRLPKKWTGPVNEYYQWCPSPRTKTDIKVLVSIDPTALPFGNGDGQHASDVIPAGVDVPVVWTNTKFRRMIYSSIGHGASALGTDTTYTTLLTDAIMWLGTKASKTIDEASAMYHRTSAPGVVTGKEFVSVNGPADASVNVTLLNAQGRSVRALRGIRGSCRFSRQSLAPGVYVLYARYRGEVVSKRLFLK
jgi:hypothetical protein